MSIKMLFFDYRENEKKFFEGTVFANCDVKFFSNSLDSETVDKISQQDLDNTFAISVFIHSMLTEDVISKFKNLRVIITRSTGYDHINKYACLKRNIALINIPDYGEISVAEFTVCLMLSLLRKLPLALKSVSEQTFTFQNFVGRDLRNLNVGIIGTGSIGGAVCKLLKSFNANVFAYDINKKQELIEKYGVIYKDLDDLISQSDVISLHIPYVKENYHLFSDEKFEIMRPNSYFINVSRGELVDLSSLKKYIDNGKISGVALDVVACPCMDKCKDFANKIDVTSLDCLTKSEIILELTKLPNVIITPHIAYESQNSIDYILKETFKSLSEFVNGSYQNRIL